MLLDDSIENLLHLEDTPRFLLPLHRAARRLGTDSGAGLCLHVRELGARLLDEAGCE